MRRSLTVLVLICSVLSAVAAGCAKREPPCPPGARNLDAAQADEALERTARKKVALGQGGDLAADVTCRGSGPRGTIGIPYRRVLECVEQTIPLASTLGQPTLTLSECLLRLAKIEYARHFVLGLPDDFDLEEDMDVAQRVFDLARNTKCVEVERHVEVEASKHGLNRDASGDWVPVVLWLLQAADAVMAPAMFMIKPAAGVEEACEDVPPSTGPAKRCTEMSGCPDQPPGAEDPASTGSGGGIIPPGTDPGTPVPGDGTP